MAGIIVIMDAAKRTNEKVAIGRLVLLAILAIATGMLQIDGFARQDPHASKVKSYPVVEGEIYDRILDLVFPKSSPDAQDLARKWSLVLRFKPNDERESQIVITRGEKRSQVLHYTSPDGSIFDRLNEMLDHDQNADLVAMSKSIRVTRNEVSASNSQVKQWSEGFFSNFSATSKALQHKGQEFDRKGYESFFLHGTFYELWYIQGLTEMSFSLYDVDVNKAGVRAEYKLVEWMNRVRRDVEKSARN